MVKKVYVVSRISDTDARTSWPVFVTEHKWEADEIVRSFGGIIHDVPFVHFEDDGIRVFGEQE